MKNPPDSFGAEARRMIRGTRTQQTVTVTAPIVYALLEVAAAIDRATEARASGPQE